MTRCAVRYAEVDALEAAAKVARGEANEAESRRAAAEKSLASLAADLDEFAAREKEAALRAKAAAAEVKTLEVASQEADDLRLDLDRKSQKALQIVMVGGVAS